MDNFEKLLGLTLTEIEGAEPESEHIDFIASNGARVSLCHYQDCCESVAVAEVIGDITDLIGTPILQAEVAVFDDENPPGTPTDAWYDECFRWTFYKLATVKGYVTIRWLGSSNGYYSVAVYSKYTPPLENSDG